MKTAAIAKDGFAVVAGYHAAQDRAAQLVADLPGYHRLDHRRRRWSAPGDVMTTPDGIQSHDRHISESQAGL